MSNSQVMTQQLYIKVFLAIFALTILTFVQAKLMSPDLQSILWLQMVLALLKTFFIVAYYMHLKYESKLYKIIVLMAIVTLAIFFIITASDAIFRNEAFDLFQGG